MFEHVTRGGRYFRVCDPLWKDPSDTSYSKIKGGRWNVASSASTSGFGALYLNATVDVAIANARRHVWSTFRVVLEDLLPEKLPDLQEYDVHEHRFVDAVTPSGISKLGLPSDYATVTPHPPCQRIAQGAYDAGEKGIAPLSAVKPSDEELVIFDRVMPLLITARDRRRASSWLPNFDPTRSRI